MVWVIVTLIRNKRVHNRDGSLTPAFEYAAQARNYLVRRLPGKTYKIEEVGNGKIVNYRDAVQIFRNLELLCGVKITLFEASTILACLYRRDKEQTIEHLRTGNVGKNY